MKSSPSPLSTATPLSDETTLAETLDCLLENIPLAMEGDYTRDSVFQLMLRAASQRDSIEHTSTAMENVPHGNTLRYHLDKFDDMAQMEAQVNQALQSRLPKRLLKKKKLRLAIDLNLIPFYGKPTAACAPYIYRCAAKAGTTSFFAYATLYVIEPNKRVTLAIRPIHCHETLVATVTFLLAYLSPLRLRVKRLYLDRGFYCVPVIRWLKALDIPFLMPAIIQGKQGGSRALCKGRASYSTTYTLNSGTYGQVECSMHVVCSYFKGRRRRHGIQYCLYVSHRYRLSLASLHHDYRYRFGIESSYRLKNLCRIRSTTKNPVLRLLYVALAFIIVNVWIYLLWTYLRIPLAGGSKVFRNLFPLKQMLEFLSHAVERRFPPIRTVAIPRWEQTL